MANECTEATFLKDVANHVMTVRHDDGVYRHLRFAKPGSSAYHFDLVTYPDHLVFSGDMGTYVFQRLVDMFQFFRSDKGRINPGYWSEKLQAVDCSGRQAGKCTEFSKDKFERVIKEQRLEWIREGGLQTKEQRRELWEAIDNDILAYLDDGEHAVYARANDFSWQAGPWNSTGYGHGRGSFHFQDLWDHNFEEYTFHFIWACYAIAWGVAQYDQSKEIK